MMEKSEALYKTNKTFLASAFEKNIARVGPQNFILFLYKYERGEAECERVLLVK